MFTKVNLTLILCFMSLHLSVSSKPRITKCCRKNNFDNSAVYWRSKIIFCCETNSLETQEICTDSLSKSLILPQIYSNTYSDIRNLNKLDSYSAMNFDIIYHEHPGSYYDLPDPENNEKIFLLQNGTLIVHNFKTSSFYTLDYRDYCLVNVLEENGPRVIVHGFYSREIDSESSLETGHHIVNFNVHVAFKTLEETIKKLIDKALQIVLWIDVSFLVATFLVLVLLPEKRSVHEILLMTYVFCLCISTSLVAYMKSTELETDNNLWVILACVEYFFFLAGVFWMDIMSSDIRCSIWKIGNSSSSSGTSNYSVFSWGNSNRQNKQNKFIFYSIYAWGSSLFITRLCLQKNFFPGISTLSKSDPGEDSWKISESSRVTSTLYFVLGIILIYSIILIILAVRRIYTYNENPTNYESDSQRHVVDNENEHRYFRFSLYSKLFIVTGINWTFEIISFVFKNNTPEYIWIIPNFFNALQGLFIFVFIFSHRNVRQSLLNTICCMNSVHKMEDLTEGPFSYNKKPPIFSGEIHKEELSVVVAQYEKLLDGE